MLSVYLGPHATEILTKTELFKRHLVNTIQRRRFWSILLARISFSSAKQTFLAVDNMEGKDISTMFELYI